jgi:hypothetical protein
MVDPMDDIARQARQGSVAAVIQILNEKLADSGVRTRAIFAEGILQLLCEASKVEQLEQSILVDRVRQILENISPRNIRRVNINSRIVREQQLLWLDEINRDPENQLLWSEEISLRQPNPLKRFFEDLKIGKETKAALPTTSPRVAKEKRQFWRGIVGGVSLSVLLLLVGWVVYDWLQGKSEQASEPEPSPTVVPDPVVSPSPVATLPAGQDPFVQAVRIAEQAAQDGQSAQSSADWLELATRWQRASDLMSQVPAEDGRYTTARDRINVYRQNSEAALRRAQSQQPSPTPTPATAPAQAPTQAQ